MNNSKALNENLKELEKSDLPPHLKSSLEKYYRKAGKFGLDPNFFAKVKKEADKRGDDFNPIHGVIG